jgi:hypothetical protein
MHEYLVLQDFTALAKAMGYVFAGVCLLGLIPFWLYLTGGEDKGKKRNTRR